MNEQPKITVIVAIYKVEKYIRKCIESILNQTYRNLEVILVNDGSPDNSLSICEEYAAKDSRVVVLTKENGGQSTARNYALDRCHGDYIGFIDGDDWIESQMYEVMLKAAVDFEADIIQCACVLHNNGSQRKDVPNRQVKVYSGEEAVRDLLSPSFAEINTSVCNKLFKREAIGTIRFTPVRAFEDDEFNVRTLAVSKKVVCIPEWLYDYNQHEGSTMTNSFNINKVALVTIQRNITDFVENNIPDLYPQCEKVLLSKELYTLANLVKYKSVDKDGAGFNYVFRGMLRRYKSYMSNNLIGQSKRLILFAIKSFPLFIIKPVLKLLA